MKHDISFLYIDSHQSFYVKWTKDESLEKIHDMQYCCWCIYGPLGDGSEKETKQCLKHFVLWKQTDDYL